MLLLRYQSLMTTSPATTSDVDSTCSTGEMSLQLFATMTVMVLTRSHSQPENRTGSAEQVLRSAAATICAATVSVTTLPRARTLFATMLSLSSTSSLIIVTDRIPRLPPQL